ncbi:MAG TPA: HAMP domain-containing sensor histidine kinase [Longimicrobiaceae bacterium]|nr:HAMP domain-containing sensor histidine kinase [Longimicrobiaceae bacterium]
MSTQALHECLHRFPGAALELSADGVVRASNGHLDALAGRELVGVTFDEILDSSSQAKWQRILSEPERANPACTWELVITTPTSLELRTFLAVWGGAQPEAVLWLLEFSADPKLELLYGELSELNRELVEAQRKLSREKDRLARALEEAQAAVRSRDDVLAVVSHDLRNPVSTITMAAGLLELPIPQQKKAEQIAIIKRAAAGMNHLIADLLDVSAIESGRFRIELEPLSLPPVMEESCRMLEEQAAQKGQRLECSISAEVPEVLGDRDRILQVLSNLMGNAIKFTPEGGAITVRTESGAGEVIVSVQDTGRGIAEADLPHVFDRFWHTSQRRRGGAGLGLAIVKGIIEAHGGRIWVESTLGRGSTFSFALPVMDGAQRGTTADSLKGSSRTGAFNSGGLS